MRHLIVLALLALAQAAINIDFRGLDERYMVQPESLYYVRRAYSCHLDLPVAAVHIATVSRFGAVNRVPEYINAYTAPRDIPCDILAATHWDKPLINYQPVRHYLHLYRLLAEEEPTTLTVELLGPVGHVRPYELNMLPFLASSVDENYADILTSNPELFVEIGALPVAQRPVLMRLLQGTDMYLVAAAVAALHCLGGGCLFWMARRSHKRKFSDIDESGPNMV
jgi:hypothetical protein